MYAMVLAGIKARPKCLFSTALFSHSEGELLHSSCCEEFSRTLSVSAQGEAVAADFYFARVALQPENRSKKRNGHTVPTVSTRKPSQPRAPPRTPSPASRPKPDGHRLGKCRQEEHGCFAGWPELPGF